MLRMNPGQAPATLECRSLKPPRMNGCRLRTERTKFEAQDLRVLHPLRQMLDHRFSENRAMERHSLSIPWSPEPRQADVDKFTAWLRSLGVKPIEPARIRSTTGTLESLERPGITQTNFLGSLGELLHFKQDWHLAYDFSDYRLTYDARRGNR